MISAPLGLSVMLDFFCYVGIAYAESSMSKINCADFNTIELLRCSCKCQCSSVLLRRVTDAIGTCRTECWTATWALLLPACARGQRVIRVSRPSLLRPEILSFSILLPVSPVTWPAEARLDGRGWCRHATMWTRRMVRVCNCVRAG